MSNDEKLILAAVVVAGIYLWQRDQAQAAAALVGPPAPPVAQVLSPEAAAFVGPPTPYFEQGDAGFIGPPAPVSTTEGEPGSYVDIFRRWLGW